MFRYAVGYIIFLTLTLQTFSVYLLKADYILNQKLYEQQCINKKKPALKCHGKCGIGQKMAEAEKQEQQQSGKKDKQSGLDEIVLAVSYPNFNLYKKSSIYFIGLPVSDITIERKCGEVFQPPRFS